MQTGPNSNEELILATDRLAQTIKALTSEESRAAEARKWRNCARQEQLPPLGGWNTWLFLGGRGSGKTRAAAEFHKEEIKAGRATHAAFIAPTASDLRRVMVEGPLSGILAVWRNEATDEQPEYQPSNRRILFPKYKSVALLYSAEEPERLRGPQHDFYWFDELCAADGAEQMWEQLHMGLRLGKFPRGIVTTTPRPMQLLRDIRSDAYTATTVSTSYANRANLPPAWYSQIIARYEGTRFGQQELEAVLLEETPDSLWKKAVIDRLRIERAPELRRIVVAVDPATTSKGKRGDEELEIEAESSNRVSNETGIVVVGIGENNHAYVLWDGSMRATPSEWAAQAVQLYERFHADGIVAEKNQGGEMVESTLRAVDANIPYRGVHASRGKTARAEPVAALYDKGRVHHVRIAPDGEKTDLRVLEDQMCLAKGTLILLKRGWTEIENVTIKDFAYTRSGWKRVIAARQTGIRSLWELVASNDSVLRATNNHPIYVENKGFIPCSEVQNGDRIVSCQSSRFSPLSFSTASVISVTPVIDITRPAEPEGGYYSTVACGSRSMVQSQRAGTSTTKTKTGEITHRIISKVSVPKTITTSTDQRVASRGTPTEGVERPRNGGTAESPLPSRVVTAEDHFSPDPCVEQSRVVVSATTVGEVFNLEVEDQHEYFANGILTHNCAMNTIRGYTGRGSPDHLDALVWACFDLILSSESATVAFLDVSAEKHTVPPKQLDYWLYRWVSVSLGPTSVAHWYAQDGEQVRIYRELVLDNANVQTVGAAVAKQSEEDLKNVTLLNVYLDAGHFDAHMGHRSIAQQFSDGINREIGHGGSFLYNFNAVERHTAEESRRVFMLQQRETDAKDHRITLLAASGEPEAAWEHLRELLRWKPLQERPQLTWDRDFYLKLKGDDPERAEQYVKAVKMEAPAEKPRLAIDSACPATLRALGALSRDDKNASMPVLIGENGAVAQSVLAGMQAHRETAVRQPLEEFVAQRLSAVRARRGDQMGQDVVIAVRQKAEADWKAMQPGPIDIHFLPVRRRA